MKAFKTAVLTIAIAGTAFSVNASPQQHQGLELCKAEIQGLYGDKTELSLVDVRRDMSGSSMRIAARLDEDNSRFVSCWVPRQESGSAGYASNSTRLASVSTKPTISR